MQMPPRSPAPYSTFGYHLLDSLDIPDKALNLLFAALILTVLGVFIGGNLLLLDSGTFWRSALITLPCLGLVFLFYSLSRYLHSLIWGLALAYCALWVIAFVRQPVLVYVSYALFALAIFYAARHLRVARRDWLPILLMAVLGVAMVLGVERAYTSFDMLPRLQAGSVHQDTLYHASIAAMIKNYGVVSTGLNGLVATPYHVFSHTLIAGISRLSGTGVIEVYGVATWVLFAPLLLFCVAACVAMFDRAGQLSLQLVWTSAALLLVALPLLGDWQWDSYFVSESYLVSLSVFVLGLGLLSKRRLSGFDLLLVVLTAALISNAKASVGVIYGGLWLVRLLWLSTGPRWMDFSAFLLSLLAVGWVVFDSARASSGGMSISPLHFVRTYSLWGGHLAVAGSALMAGVMPPVKTLLLGAASLAGFVLFHFLLSWILIAQIGYRQGAASVLKAPLGVYSVAAIAAGLLITFTVAIPGGSAYYFSNVAMFVALPGIAVMLTQVCQRRRTDERLLAGVGIVLICLISWRAFYNHSALHPEHAKQPDSSLLVELLKIRDSASLDLVLKPQMFWLEKTSVQPCSAKPFVFPAVSERPWVGVIEPASDCNYENYGYSQYGIVPGEQHLRVSPRLLPQMSIQYGDH